ncbi:MAG: LacI family DNA-binding transcriptional regulator [Oribacterium sp.]|nr:LacI family DNA-binding transcriptional regulator [Oribacterium sp.]
MKLTIYDIAEKAGVSPATVSRVINKKGNVGAATRKRVEDIIAEENYVPNATAQNLSNGSSHLLVFIVPDIENPFFGKILHGITERAEEMGYSVLLYGTDGDLDKEHQILHTLRTDMIEGVFISIAKDDDQVSIRALERLKSGGIPVVLVDRDIVNTIFDGIFSDDQQGAYDAVQCLIKEGHRNIGIITGPEHSLPSKSRLTGYRMALEDENIPYRREYVVDGNFRIEESYRATEQLINLKIPPSAIFTCNNLSTLGCLHYLTSHGYTVGKDISLISFDEIPELTYGGVRLTSVDRPVVEMGYEAMNIMYRRLTENQGTTANTTSWYDKIVQRSFVKTKIVLRGSEKLNPKESKDKKL